MEFYRYVIRNRKLSLPIAEWQNKRLIKQYPFMINPDNRSSTIGLILLLGTLLFPSGLLSQDLDVPYVPTPPNVVERMLDVAGVNSSDYVIDLGSGDGRIVIAAAKRGASGHGIDLDPKRVAEARNNARNNQVDKKIMFLEENIFKSDFSRASVITMYLLPTINDKLRPVLLDKLEPGTRIVSHSFDMGPWRADKKMNVADKNGNPHEVFYWVVPAQVGGRWSWSNGQNDFILNINQHYQEITAKLTDSNGNTYTIKESIVHADRITIRAEADGKNIVLSGRVESDRILGTMQVHHAGDKTLSKWTVTKTGN